jgi:iron complex outermembrane receptor protein
VSVSSAQQRAAVFLSMLGLTLTAVSPVLFAQQAPQDTHALDEIVVVGVTPVPGFKVDKDKIPGNIQTLRSSDLTRNGAANALNALDQQSSTVNFNDTLADPFQPDVLFRGFEASPVLGTPQGIAVYQNGVRINEAFGRSHGRRRAGSAG